RRYIAHVDNSLRLHNHEIVDQPACGIQRLSPYARPGGFEIGSLNLRHELLQRSSERLFVQRAIVFAQSASPVLDRHAPEAWEERRFHRIPQIEVGLSI